MMKKIVIAGLVISLMGLSTGCAKKFKEKEAALNQPINCSHAEADIRALESEKAHVGEQIQAGLMSIVPVSLVGGLAAGTSGTKAKIATGEYDKQLDAKIKEIKETCEVK
ncbi:MAG: hypothetical protein GQ542_14740 [Desulforhopalus sp.]|nr:hypothetical protein [Desulforhopalus sp.]